MRITITFNQTQIIRSLLFRWPLRPVGLLLHVRNVIHCALSTLSTYKINCVQVTTERWRQVDLPGSFWWPRGQWSCTSPPCHIDPPPPPTPPQTSAPGAWSNTVGSPHSEERGTRRSHPHWGLKIQRGHIISNIVKQILRLISPKIWDNTQLYQILKKNRSCFSVSFPQTDTKINISKNLRPYTTLPNIKEKRKLFLCFISTWIMYLLHQREFLRNPVAFCNSSFIRYHPQRNFGGEKPIFPVSNKYAHFIKANFSVSTRTSDITNTSHLCVLSDSKLVNTVSDVLWKA